MDISPLTSCFSVTAVPTSVEPWGEGPAPRRKQSEDEWLGRRMWRVCTGTLIH